MNNDINKDTIKSYEFNYFTESTETGTIENYDFKSLASINKPEIEDKPDSYKAKGIADNEARKIIEEAKQLAESVIAEANKKAASIMTEAEKTGYQKGYEDGCIYGQQCAFDEHSAAFERDRQYFLDEIRNLIEKIDREKDNILSNHFKELRDLAVAIAEKVIHINLESNGQIIEKMILSATEKIKNKQWAKIYISGHDAEQMIRADIDILESAKYISEQLRLSVMDNKPAGSCIIELPDQIIDTGADTQMENIKELLGMVHKGDEIV